MYVSWHFSENLRWQWSLWWWRRLWWSCEPVLTSHSVFPNRLFNLIKEFDDNWDFYELKDSTCITFFMHRTSSSPSPSMLLVTDSSSLTLISGPSTWTGGRSRLMIIGNNSKGNDGLPVWRCPASQGPFGHLHPPEVATDKKKDDIRSPLFQFCSTCPILKLNYLQRVKQVLTLLAPSTFLSKHPGRWEVGNSVKEKLCWVVKLNFRFAKKGSARLCCDGGFHIRIRIRNNSQ